ncbi:unnamed protein product [Prunus armeniaca]
MERSSQTPVINTSLTNPNESPSPIPTTATTATTEPLVQGGTSTLPSIPKKRIPIRKPLEVWKHFTKDTVEPGCDIGPRASCNYCHQSYACDPVRNDTSTLLQHLKVQCTGGSPLKEDNKQKVLSFDKGGLVSHTYSTERSRLACVKMIIIDEHPFRHVEGIGFNFFVKELQPRFDPPSRRTIARDVWSLFQEEKAKLKSVISQNSQRVSLNMDTWTSLQNGDAIGRLVEKCLSDWGIEKVFTITLNNATANDGAIRHMKRQLGQ